MPYIPVIEEADAGPELGAVYERVTKARGAVANILKVHSLLPDTLGPHLDLYLATMFANVKGALGRRERELIAVVVSATNKCDYCVAHHADALSHYMRDERQVGHVRSDWRRAKLTPKEEVLCEFAEQLTRNPSTVRAAHVDALRRAGHSEEAILQTVLTTSYFNFVNRMALGLGVDHDDVRQPYQY